MQTPKTGHMKTPWKYLDQGIISENLNQWGNFCILEMPKGRDENHLAMAENEANAQHIVKCVNCHDELVEALEACIDWFKEYKPEVLNNRWAITAKLPEHISKEAIVESIIGNS